MKDRLLNFGLYQSGWFIMVLGAARGHPWAGSAAGLALVAAHLLLARERGSELMTILTIGVLGTLVDSAQALAGVFVFESGYWNYWFVPLWLTVMWMQFATLFHYILAWLNRRYLLAAVLGAMGGPVAYLTGESLGAVIFPMGTGRSLLFLAAVWFIATPACVFIAGRFSPRRGNGSYRL